MYQAVAPKPRTETRTGPVVLPLRLSAVRWQDFPVGRDRIGAPDLHTYFADLTRGYDLGHRPERVAQVAGTTFISMARELLAGCVTEGTPVDLAIVAHATPEFDPRLSAPVNLTAVLPGGPLTFTVGGNGRLAVFTALRVAAAHAWRHGHRRVLVLAMDQGATPYDLPEPVRDGAAALLLEAGDGSVEVQSAHDVGAEDVPRLLADLLCSVPGDARLVTGPGVRRPEGWSGGAATPSGYPCSGLWAGLAGDVGRPLVLADYDPAHRELSACVVR